MDLANVNDHQQAKLLFDEYNIPYKIITRGENKGMLRVKPLRPADRYNLLQTKFKLEQAGLNEIADHGRCFRDAEDNTVVMFSPYNICQLPSNCSWLIISDYSIYGMGTKTFIAIIPNEDTHT